MMGYNINKLVVTDSNGEDIVIIDINSPVVIVKNGYFVSVNGEKLKKHKEE